MAYIKAILSLLLLGIIISCGAGVSSNPFANNNTACTNGCLTSASLSLRVTSDSATMTINDNQVQLGGSCNPGDFKSNLVQFWVFPPGTTVPTGSPDIFGNYFIGSGSNAYTGTGICDNGNFFVIIPRAMCNSSGLYLDANGACLLGSYPVITQLITSAVAGTKPLTRGPRFTAYFTVQ